MRHAFPLLLLAACNGDVLDTMDTGFDPDTSVDPDTDTEPDTEPPPVLRGDCSGIEPADAAPLGGYVTLTFDDGPDATQTAELIAWLDANDIPATFMVLGEQLDDPTRDAVTQAIVDNPLFTIGNHSYDHANLSNLGIGGAMAQVDETDALIESFGGETGYFRFPYGATTCELTDRVRETGHIVTGWHIDTGDWCYAAVGVEGVCLQEDYWRIPTEYEADMRGFILEQVDRYDGGILLFHDIHAWTVDIIPDVVSDLQQAGYTFVPLTSETAWPNLNAGTKAEFPYLGEPCDVTDDRCYEAEYMSWCQPVDDDGIRGVCTLDCEGLCPDRPGSATTFCAETSPDYGQCLARSGPINASCGLVDGSTPTTYDRFVGESGASAATATVCAP